MAIRLSSSRTSKAWKWGLILGALIVTVFALGSVAPTDASPRAPASVFAKPEVTLPRSSPESRAVALIADGKLEEARKLLLVEVKQAKEPSLGRLRYLLAKATPDIGQAREPLEALAKSDHLLAGWARLRLTERLRDVDPSAAAQHAEVLITFPIFQKRAEQMLALALYASGKPEEAEPLLRALVAEAPERSAVAPYTMPLATILAAKSDLASQKQALALYRRVVTRAPHNPQAELARVAAQGVLANLPSAQRIALGQLSADEAFAEAEALSSARDYARSAERYAAIAKRFSGDPKSVCDARLGEGTALFSAGKRDKALAVFEDVVQKCPNAEHRPSAHYQAGRVRLRRGDPKGAIAHYDAVFREFPSHKMTDDALLAAATAFVDLRDVPSARTRLQQLLTLAKGDMRPDARFMLAWLERSQANWEAALRELDQHLAEGTGEVSEDIIGRAEYWRARTLLDMGRRDESQQAFIKLFNARPLSYYGQQALARLEEIEQPVAARLVTVLRDDGPASERKNLRLPLRPELQTPGALTAMELLTVAEVQPAVEELEFVGCFKPDAPDELYLLCASLLQEFGADSPATSIARRRTTRVLNNPPKGQALALWRVVYPRAYRPLVEDTARKVDIPPAFVRAIAREESSFDPNAVSPANAYGLIQLIRPTARTYAGPLKLPSDPDSLKRPEINLRIGTSFMRSLLDRYQQNFAVVPAAYNAGPGAADRWLRERGELPLDEWVETIPYMETRKYTRRVLQSYGVYAWLDEGRVPSLSKHLPRQTPPTTASNETTTNAAVSERARAERAPDAAPDARDRTLEERTRIVDERARDTARIDERVRERPIDERPRDQAIDDRPRERAIDERPRDQPLSDTARDRPLDDRPRDRALEDTARDRPTTEGQRERAPEARPRPAAEPEDLTREENNAPTIDLKPKESGWSLKRWFN